jgi:hypothetical protein
MIEYLLLLLSWPIGKILARATGDEKEIYTKRIYFPLLAPILGILAIVFFVIDRVISLTLAFMFLTILVWSKQ